MCGLFISIAIDAYNSLWIYKLHIPSEHQKHNLQDSFASLYSSYKLPAEDLQYTYQQVMSNRADEEFSGATKSHASALMITLASKNYPFLSGQNIQSDNHQNTIEKFLSTTHKNNLIHMELSFALLTHKESRDPEFAGLLTAIVGSLFAISIAITLSIPLALSAAIYLEDMTQRDSKFAHFVRINISNLASVPSIVYGIVGYAIYIEYLDLPRSSSLVAGLTLMLMTIPNLIMTYINALRTVPSQIKNAAIALGATKQQMIFHHILPYCIPGIITGTMLVLSRMLGETAPLLMIGMAAFVIDLPNSVLEPTTTLPMQIYLWSDSPEFALVIKSSGGIIVLLSILMCIGIIALRIRKNYTIKW